MGFDTGSTRYVDLGDWSGSTCALNPGTCQQGKENDFGQICTMWLTLVITVYIIKSGRSVLIK